MREAQQALAREYGFTSWQALLDEIEVVKTRTDDLRQAIETNAVDQVCQIITEDPSILHGPNGADRATIRVPKKGGTAFGDEDTILRDVTPLGYVMHYPNDYQPGPGSGDKKLDIKPHENVIELLKSHGAPE